MIAAIYARKSTEQHAADPDGKSVARQIENARAFAASRGWTVPEHHVYADDAVSGAETPQAREPAAAARFDGERPRVLPSAHHARCLALQPPRW
jgi:hypothetical protein